MAPTTKLVGRDRSQESELKDPKTALSRSRSRSPTPRAQTRTIREYREAIGASAANTLRHRASLQSINGKIDLDRLYELVDDVPKSVADELAEREDATGWEILQYPIP